MTMIKLNPIAGSTLFSSMLAAALVLLASSEAAAQQASAQFSADQGFAAAGPNAAPRDDSGAFLGAGKVGGILPFSGLGPFVNFGVELGYVFGGTGRSIGALLDVSYTAPPADGTQSEDFDPPRVEGGEYEWKLVQKQLVLGPTFLYRFTMLELDPLTLYGGIGPRVYLLESKVEGSAGGEPFGETPERSTKLGVGVPLGVEYALGPGGLLAELLFQWGPLNHRVTGDAHLASATLFVGYRALL
jgi:opacity protein-like surface antigen